MAMYHFPDLATLFCINVPQQSDINTHTTQIEELTIEQSSANKELESHGTDTTPKTEICLSGTPQIHHG